uniref:Uncharacterized protein n=1 Tax=Arundo donax TaxID=35708 RepID=A0A0A9AWQ2_ARUDO
MGGRAGRCGGARS